MMPRVSAKTLLFVAIGGSGADDGENEGCNDGKDVGAKLGNEEGIEVLVIVVGEFVGDAGNNDLIVSPTLTTGRNTSCIPSAIAVVFSLRWFVNKTG
mmetsp:Transcript_31693/g.67155  ORF Transcript_31693/g.67155 Transcript_31693/m.67155 type:complete len:97 (-) Transcript_31693:980-1270(-)